MTGNNLLGQGLLAHVSSAYLLDYLHHVRNDNYYATDCVQQTDEFNFCVGKIEKDRVLIVCDRPVIVSFRAACTSRDLKAGEFRFDWSGPIFGSFYRRLRCAPEPYRIYDILHRAVLTRF